MVKISLRDKVPKKEVLGRCDEGCKVIRSSEKEGKVDGDKIIGRGR